MKKLSQNFYKLICVAFLIRLLLIFYGQWQDRVMEVKYTDVDYHVFNDAALAVANGESPYTRTTYRYTPLLAYILLVNVYIHESLGKYLFSLSDIAIGILLYKIVSINQLSEKKLLSYVSLWLFHPFSINISTRGNADSFLGFLVLSVLYLLLQKRIIIAAIIYGIATHFKIYPIIYVFSFLMFIDDSNLISSRLILNRNRILFALVSFLTFLVLTAIFYYKYQYTFLYEAYIYHFIRTDNRHNFSVYFYHLYLYYNTSIGFTLGLLSFLPQIALVFVIAWFYGKDLPIALFLHTFSFVVFNKVCTAQYFVWYTSLVPLILPYCTISLKTKWIPLTVFWFCAELYWLYWAYLLEFEGENVFFQLWIASLLFFTINVWILVEIIGNIHPLVRK